MPDYKAMYFHLAGKVADTIDLLVQVQLECERAAMEDGKPGIALAPKEDGGGCPSCDKTP